MDKCTVLLSALGSLLLLARTPAANSSNMTRTLTLLTLVPFFDSRPDAGWDRGLEVLPMGRIAKDEINQREDILPGYELELIEANSEACAFPVISRALVNFATNAIGLTGNSTVVGVVGLPCSTVTANLSPLAGRNEVSLIQMSMSNSPDLRNSTLYPRLWRTVSSSIVYVNATLALMDKFNWSKISTVYSENGIFYSNTARDLVSEVEKNPNQRVILDIAVDESENYIESALDQVQSLGARIVFVSSTGPEAVLIMCAAARKKLTLLGYQFIFHSLRLDSFLNNTSECDDEMILNAMENVILLQWKLTPDDTSRRVYSGKSIQELQQLYLKELKSLIKEEQYSEYTNDFSCEDQPWAYPLYDEIWAFALALNMSLPDLEAKNLTLNDYHFGNEFVTQIIENHLATVSFEGAIGHISFDAHRESLTSIKVYQVRNGTENLIGSYSKLKGLVFLNVSDVIVAPDEFQKVYLQTPQALRVILYLINAIILVMITSLLILTLFYHRSPVIKANSTLLNSLIFFGCYCICLSSLAHTLVLEKGLSKDIYTAFCNISIWCSSVGLCMILGTNLVKLGRIYRIFTHMGNSGWLLLTNYALFVYVLLLEIFPVVLILAWNISDKLQYENFTLNHFDKNPPHVEYLIQCNCKYYPAWQAALLAYFAIMLMTLIFFASQTRKIKLSHFKDTKKIIFFVVFLSLTLILSTSSWIILRHIINHEIGQYESVPLILGNFIICLLCLVFLIAPKALPVFHQHITTGQYQSAASLRTRTPKPSIHRFLAQFK